MPCRDRFSYQGFLFRGAGARLPHQFARNLREQIVWVLFFCQRLAEQLGDVGPADLSRHRTRRSVPRYFVVLHLLRGGDEREIGRDIIFVLSFLMTS